MRYQNLAGASRISGFTLVELAVSLIVIGLIVGMLVRGTELISSAKVRNIIDQKTSIQTAIVAFANRYKATAGDLTAAQASFIGDNVILPSIKGFGDGVITLVEGADDESVLVFQNLTATGLLSCNTCIATANEQATSTNSPHNADQGFLQFGTAAAAAGTGVLWLDTAAQTGRNILTTGSRINAPILQQIDLKADDGTPNAGAFRQSTSGGADTTINCTTGAGTAWSTTAVNCAGAWLF